jgi:two-component system, OmpR family, phosphate regulon sensor histidine kinase PhoR
MKKSYFLALMTFMILSVGGIILIQWYFIYTAIDNREEEFSMAVKASLSAVANEIQENELLHYIETFENLTDSIAQPSSSQLGNYFMFYDSDDESNLSSLFTFGILQEDYNIPLAGDDSGSTKLTDLKGIATTRIFKEAFDRENRRSFSTERFQRIERINSIDRATFASFFSNMANTFPIHKRLDTYELTSMLEEEFTTRNIDTPFEFVILSDGLATKVGSNNYREVKSGPQYNIPIFVDNEGASAYDLIVSFPEKNSFVLSSIIGVASLSFILTLLIVILCGISLYQILQQKKISEIKSDFINNMSHEFKTPIATINLAIDAIENPINIKDEKKVSRYLKMMREENKRMQDQVETVLMISQLERGTTPMELSPIDVHEVVEEAISHVALIVQNRAGMIYKHLDASFSNISGNKNHLTNVITNLLDNAIKYSEGSPIIEVRTWSEEKDIAIEVKDQGMGMDAETLQLIFEKFYREQGGNVHNIKGHGLGLSYVKKIVHLLNGTIHVKSKKDKGSTFTIRFPLTEV